MKKQLYWIDDSEDDQKLPSGKVKSRIEEKLRVTLLPDRPTNSRAQFVELMSAMDPSTTLGVVMDYQLTNVAENNTMALGTTYAAEIRSRHPAIPIVGISHCIEKEIPRLQLQNFLAFFPRNELMGVKPKLDDLMAILLGFHDIYELYTSKTIPGVQIMGKVLNAPHKVAPALANALPPYLSAMWDQETPHVAGRWIWHELLGRPGYLCDEIGLATQLGLNYKALGLNRILNKFTPGLYKGAFNSVSRPRWWVSQIRAIAEQIVGQPIVGPISNARDVLLTRLKIKKADQIPLFSRCYGHAGLLSVPDCVAYKDDQLEESDRVQALFSDTIIDSRDRGLSFGFEARRIFAGKCK